MDSAKQSVVAIAGGYSGIGQTAAEAFVRKGYQLVIVGRYQDTLAAISFAAMREKEYFL